MASKVDCYNLALTFLDISQTVQSPNDATVAAGTLNRFWDYARKRVLEKCYWDFATKTAALALLLDQKTISSQPLMVYPGWRYVYQLPNDCLRALAVTTQFGLRTYPHLRSWWYGPGISPMFGPWRPPWRRANSDGQNASLPFKGTTVLTDQDAAWFVYVEDVQNVALWSQSFMEAVAWNLAKPAAGPLSANQTAKKMAVEMAEKSIISALEIELNERQEDPYPDSPAITARN